MTQDRMTIKGRLYEIEEIDEKTVKVSGRIFGKGGRLLPGLSDAMVERLRSAGYPVGDSHSEILFPFEQGPKGPLGTLVFYYHPTGWYKVFYEPFAREFKSSAEALALRQKAETLDRRFHLAEALGLKLNNRAWLYDPIRAIRQEFKELAARRWAAHGHPYPNIQPDEPRFTFDYTQYGYRVHFRIEAGDRAWLFDRLAEVTEVIEAMDEGALVSILKKKAK